MTGADRVDRLRLRIARWLLGLAPLAMAVAAVLLMRREWDLHPFDPAGHRYGQNHPGQLGRLSTWIGIELLVFYAMLRPWSYQRGRWRGRVVLLVLGLWAGLMTLMRMHAGGLIHIHGNWNVALWLVTLAGVLLAPRRPLHAHEGALLPFNPI